MRFISLLLIGLIAGASAAPAPPNKAKRAKSYVVVLKKGVDVKTKMANLRRGKVLMKRAEVHFKFIDSAF